jgi:hypothetical protein
MMDCKTLLVLLRRGKPTAGLEPASPSLRAFAGLETWGPSRAWTDTKCLLSGDLRTTGARGARIHVVELVYPVTYLPAKMLPPALVPASSTSGPRTFLTSLRTENHASLFCRSAARR